MEKYGTYLVYKNKITGELKRVPLDLQEDIVKLANNNEWYEIDIDPEIEDKKE